MAEVNALLEEILVAQVGHRKFSRMSYFKPGHPAIERSEGFKMNPARP
jgi:hypothetical protein